MGTPVAGGGVQMLKRQIGDNRWLFPAVQLIREMRAPLAGRYASARHGQDLSVLRHQEQRAMSAHPWATMARLFGAGSRTGPVWGVTMVKNEQQRIEGSVRQLLDGGVDALIVADNLSTDRTRAMLEDLAAECPLVVIDDREPAHYQGPKMSRLARSAARCGASWIVPFDADELWYGVGKPLAERLRSLDGDAAPAPVFDFLPGPGQDAVDNPYVELTRRTTEPVTEKTAFRAHLLAAIASGNHTVAQPTRAVHSALMIRHYPFLSFADFVRKVREGDAALAATDLGPEIGSHWREWALIDDAELPEVWRTVVSRDLVTDPLPTRCFVAAIPEVLSGRSR